MNEYVFDMDELTRLSHSRIELKDHLLKNLTFHSIEVSDAISMAVKENRVIGFFSDFSRDDMKKSENYDKGMIAIYNDHNKCSVMPNSMCIGR